MSEKLLVNLKNRKSDGNAPFAASYLVMQLILIPQSTKLFQIFPKELVLRDMSRVVWSVGTGFRAGGESVRIPAPYAN